MIYDPGVSPSRDPRQENPKAFKHWIGPALVDRLAAEIDRVRPGLPTRTLRELSGELASLELKARVTRIREALFQVLPPRYPDALPILLDVAQAPRLSGFDLWPVTDYIQTHGLADFDRSMRALHALTQRFTAEWALRPFLKTDRAATFEVLRRWAQDENLHVRRAASEGSRPHLPWGERVPSLIADPADGLDVLERLRFDPDLYVRRSVANHLNDIARDHPDRVVRTLRRWRRECPPDSRKEVEWTVRHALRGLVKRGHHGALATLGVDREPQVVARSLTLERSRLRIGDTLDFSLTLVSTTDARQKLVVDYMMHFVTARGGHATKVFKLRTFTIGGRERVSLAKRHSLKPITTRIYYPGEHRLAIQVNGVVMLERRWLLEA